MCAGENNDNLAKNSEPDEIRETMNNCLTNILVYDLVNEWGFSESVDDL
jgi:hypothetical protein